MTSVKKRRSGRKSGGHRKHSDGGYSDTSSSGSYPDETDREVSNLTDRAFRSLCIGDEAVYNDSDLCPSSPCTQRDRQLAFSQSGQNRDGEDKEREELKRPAHESFSLRMQQYGQDRIHGRIYEAEIQRDPQWEVDGERTQGRVSATFQHSFVENSQHEEPLGEEQSSFLSNGATELSTQQRRSRSRVSSLIRAFNSEGRDGAGMDGKVREWNDETSWDKSALMSIQREISELSTSYQQNFNSGHFPSAGPFSSPDTNFYSSEVAAAAHMNSASSFMRSSHSTHSMSEQFDCNSNFFIHSEFSPFKVWRDHNRFPFQQAEVSGFMHCSEFPKWYETPMYRELSLDAQPQGPYRFDERGVRHPRNTLAPVVPPSLPRSTSASTIMQKASAVEKRCESDLTGHYPHRTWMQSLGTKRFPMQRSSTASPTSEMARRVQDTISSVKALQQKIKMMTEQNITTGITANQQGVHCSSNNLNHLSNNAIIVEPNAVSSSTSTTPFNISQLLTPLVNAHHEAETPEVRQSAVSPQPMEHPPVQAESRGATPDVRMSSYKSRATGLLFNLKDNRKRVKSTYSPTKFKGLETMEKNKQYSTQEPRDTVIDIPDFPDPDFQLLQVEGSSTTNAASTQYVNQYYSPGLFTTPNSQPAHTGLYSEYTSSDYQRAQMQSDMVNPSGFTGLIPENYASYRPANGQNLHEDLSSFTPYKQAMIDNVETLGGDLYRFKPSYTATEIPMLNADSNQPRAYLISKANAEQHFNETVGRDFTKVDRCQQLKENKQDYSNVSSQDRWRQTICQDTENLSLKAVSPWKQEITALMEKDQHAQAYQRADAIKEEAKSPSNKYRGENRQSINKELEKIEFRESFGVGTNSHKKAELVNTNISNQLPQNAPFSNDTAEKPAYYGQQQPGTLKDKYLLLKYNGHIKEDELKDNYLTQKYNRYTDQEYRNQHILYCNEDKSMLSQDTRQKKQNTPIPKVYEMQSLQPIEAKPQLENNVQKKSLSNPDNASAPIMANQIKDRQFAEVRTEQAMAEHIKAQHAQAELAKTQHWAQVEQPKAESARLILAGQTGSEKVKEDQAKAELTEEPRNITEEVNAEHLREERGEQFKKRAALRMDALQYYAITSTESERKPRERQLCSPLPPQQRHNPSGLGSIEDSGSHTRPHRSHAPPSPAPSLPRSNTSSPALGAKPLMFRVKDNTIRGSSFTKSVKPRFHKNFGEDFRVGSPLERGSEREEDEQEIMRRTAGTPIYPDTRSAQDYSAPLLQHKPYSRRSIALDEDDSRSVISNMSEGGESFATSAADLADIRGPYDYERPESACSFSSDVSRYLGKPPSVPQKSEKALRRAQRLTTRRIKKELSKNPANSHAGVKKSLQDVSRIPSSSSIEVRSTSCQALTSHHFSSPVSLAHAPTLGPSFPSSHTEHQSSHSSFYASPHTTGPISLPVASPHATALISLPDSSPKATGPASHTAGLKTVAHVPSSPTHHHDNHQAPVAQYHVESSYPHSYPLTQRKVLQDLGSGQYFVVDVPVQVKTKTFFDPETGKYVQLNVRQSGQNTARTQPQQTYPQPQLQPQMQVKLQQQPQASPASKSCGLYQGNHGYPQDYQPQTITSVPCGSSAPLTLHQDQQPVGESHGYGYPAHEMGQKSEGHRYSPEKTPYMDTVNDKDKPYNTVYNTHGPNEWLPESDTNSQLAGSSICENDNSAHSQCQPRDIITMCELDDFMEMSDW
ncbi:cardiac-enriched FHL2-interacting protein [Anarrhichthys ocellatus]|uniref:cardiac-enriched FHL2-interacting protein n=1 Tax=Anarrhichthys ocellatus TaxID=433405 RepID=UPI0012ED98E0|nr:cardiac-enriched FHL2-interacting protein [Anarrhichthys ocellatus]